MSNTEPNSGPTAAPIRAPTDGGSADSGTEKAHFLRHLIREDLAAGRCAGLVTRFPPEPNGYLHIGHAKSICLNFGLAAEFGGACHLRFDDTNPATEAQEYVDAIQRDLAWLGFEWAGGVRFTSAYFGQLYEWAVHLVRQGLAYVCELPLKAVRDYRGTLTEPGRDSPYRERSVADNLRLFAAMRDGEFAAGTACLRAKIDMAHPNISMRDPVLYRIRQQAHQRTGRDWCIYPSYDFAHGQADAIEGVTHSLCTLEFQDHRPLYDWFIEHLPVPARPRQYEFARLNLSHTVTSKRTLRRLVEEGCVADWDDPRMPTLAGMRRRGVRPAAIRRFCADVGVARADSRVDIDMLEHAVRDDLNRHAPRAMCVLRPLRLIIDNYAAVAGELHALRLPRHPEYPEWGERSVPFGAELFIERDDFSTDASLSRKRFKRLVLGDYVRLRGTFVIRAEQVRHDAAGQICAVHASLVPGTLGANPPPEMRPRGVIHWVSAVDHLPCRVNLYERLFTVAVPDTGAASLLPQLNPDSLIELADCRAEASLRQARAGESYQFERQGYFCLDQAGDGADSDADAPAADSNKKPPLFNRTIGLKDSAPKGSGPKDIGAGKP
ncbi:MAG: glutamine--tRNA ligase/YqeY domain fusion protein [Cellvibrionales bacterium]|nr:glutamine--tRNA ligase/YqeY domain fusion protein [Cellvibrionales bacterium]